MVNEMQELKLLLAGCGSIGKRHLQVLERLGMRNIIVCDPNPAALQALLAKNPRLKKAASFETALDQKPDAVFLCTPVSLHVPQAIMALKAGCHVFMEKPLSDKPESAAELAAVLKGSNRKFMVGLCFRYHDALVRAKKMLLEGKIGRLVAVRAMVGENLPQMRPDYHNMELTRTRGVFELMHDIDLALWYARQEAREMYCLYGAYSDIGIQAPDTAEMIIGFSDRCVASIHLDFFQKPRRRQIELIGTAGTLIVEFARWDSATISFYDGRLETWTSQTIATDRNDMFLAEDKEFLEAVVHDSPIACGLEEGLQSLKVITAAQQNRS